MLDCTVEIQFVAHGKELNQCLLKKIDVVDLYLAGIVDSVGKDEITEGKIEREGKGNLRQEQLRSDGKRSDRN